MRKCVPAGWIGLLCLVLFTSDRAAAQEVYHRLMNGSIGGKYPIQMMIDQVAGQISGQYQYVRVGQWLTVDGSKDATGTVVLREYDDAGKRSGMFTGRFTRPTVLEGTWTTMEGFSPLPFRLEAESFSPAKHGVPDRVGIQVEQSVVPRAAKGGTAQEDTRILYPLLSGLADKAVLSRLQTAVLPQKVFRGSLAEMKKDPWLTYVDFNVNCNRHAILDVSYRISGIAAYPDSYDEYLTLDLRTGKPLHARDLFQAASLPALAARIDRAMQADIHKTIQRVGKEDQEISADVRRRLAGLVFKPQHLTQFTVSAQGVIFYTLFDFPHALKGAEPDGRYFLSFAVLEPFIRHDGPLAAFLH